MNRSNGTTDFQPAKLPLYLEELWITEKLTLGLRELLRRPTLLPEEIISIGRLLHGLGALPLIDQAVCIDVSVFPFPGSNNLDLSLSLGDGDLTLAVIERHDDPQGTESICHLVASFNDGGERRFGDQWSIGYWLREWTAALKSKRTRVEISDNSEESGFDWSLKAGGNDFFAGDDDDE